MQYLLCEQCGEKNEKDSEYCERCGSKLMLATLKSDLNLAIQKSSIKDPMQMVNPISNITPTGQNSNQIIQNQQKIRILLEKKNLIYLFPTLRKTSSSLEIRDQYYNILGNIQIKSISIRKIIEFREIDKDLAFILDYKPLRIPFSYEIKTCNQEIIGRITKSFSIFKSPKYMLYNASGKIEYITQGNLKRQDYIIIPENNPLMPVAIIKPGIEMNGWPIQNIKDFQNLFGVRIIDPNLDRRKILGFVYAIKESMR